MKQCVRVGCKNKAVNVKYGRFDECGEHLHYRSDMITDGDILRRMKDETDAPVTADELLWKWVLHVQHVVDETGISIGPHSSKMFLDTLKYLSRR